MKRENIWLTFVVLGPIMAFLAVFYPALSILALIFMIIGVKGVKYDIL